MADRAARLCDAVMLDRRDQLWSGPAAENETAQTITNAVLSVDCFISMIAGAVAIALFAVRLVR
jgi:hypothetical protein